MYVPMEENPRNSKLVSRENTDYDTFGSIDSLIFEPKVPSEEDIQEAQEEITQSFQYLDNEDGGLESDTNEDIKPKIMPAVAGQTTFAERVRLFQSLGNGVKQSSGERGLENIVPKIRDRK